MLGSSAKRWLRASHVVGASLVLFALGLAAAAASPAHRRPAGAVTGTLRMRPAPVDPPPPLSPYARPRYRPPARSAGTEASVGSAVIYLEGRNLPPASAARTAQVVQRNRMILPHVIPVQVGTRVEFPNEDDVFHNIFSLSRPNRFNLGRYPPGGSKTEVFTAPGVVRLFCDIHSEMGGIVFVVDTPYFVQPDAEGRFRLDGVPPGEYTAIAWHEAAGADTVRVVVVEGGETTVDFSLGL